MATIAVGAPPAPTAPEAPHRRLVSWFAERGPAQFAAAITAVLAVWIAFASVDSSRHTRMPLPPPPAAALMSTG